MNKRPIFRSCPDRVSGIPVMRENLPFAADMPSNLFHENENPNLLPIASTSKSIEQYAEYVKRRPELYPSNI